MVKTAIFGHLGEKMFFNLIFFNIKTLKKWLQNGQNCPFWPFYDQILFYSEFLMFQD